MNFSKEDIKFEKDESLQQKPYLKDSLFLK